MFLKKLLFMLGKESKRRYQRIPADFILKYKKRGSNDKFDFGQCQDISFGGIMIASIDEKFEKDTLLDIALSLPFTFETDCKVLNVTAKVVYCEKSSDDTTKFNCGIKFVNVAPEVRSMLTKFINYVTHSHK